MRRKAQEAYSSNYFAIGNEDRSNARIFNEEHEQPRIAQDIQPASEKRKFRKFADFLQDIDEGMQDTDYFDRPSLGAYEVKALAGTAVGVAKAAAVVPFQIMGRALAAAEEFDAVFNPYVLSETYDYDKERLLYKYQAQHDSIADGISEIKNAFSHPVNSAFSAAHNLGKTVFDIANTPTDEAFNAGMVLGEHFMNARYMFFSAKTAIKLGNAGVHNVVKNYDFRPVLTYSDTKGLRLIKPIRDNRKYINPTHNPNGAWDSDSVLSVHDLNNPIPLTWEQQQKVVDWMYRRKPIIDKLTKIDLSEISDIEIRKLLRSAISQLREHMTPGDVCALLKEKEGVRIFRKNGKIFTHDKELNEAKNSLQNFFSTKTSLTREQYGVILPIANDLANIWHDYVEVLTKEKACKPKKKLPKLNN